MNAADKAALKRAGNPYWDIGMDFHKSPRHRFLDSNSHMLGWFEYAATNHFVYGGGADELALSIEIYAFDPAYEVTQTAEGVAEMTVPAEEYKTLLKDDMEQNALRWAIVSDVMDSMGEVVLHVQFSADRKLSNDDLWQFTRAVAVSRGISLNAPARLSSFVFPEDGNVHARNVTVDLAAVDKIWNDPARGSREKVAAMYAALGLIMVMAINLDDDALPVRVLSRLASCPDSLKISPFEVLPPREYVSLSGEFKTDGNGSVTGYENGTVLVFRRRPQGGGGNMPSSETGKVFRLFPTAPVFPKDENARTVVRDKDAAGFDTWWRRAENGEIAMLQMFDEDVSAANDLVIPAEIKGRPVTAIGEGAFAGGTYMPKGWSMDNRGRTCLTSVVVPDTVAAIGARAFKENCLARVVLPSGVASIGEDAFDGGLGDFYNANGKMAGAYLRAGDKWSYQAP
ncbi:MAG: leucine-rich repeat domain-containing protein [Acidobacteriota bacterium]|nr:leucine-rich repeat domain-containing protein [Acidobacteriota bacterium]